MNLPVVRALGRIEGNGESEASEGETGEYPLHRGCRVVGVWLGGGWLGEGLTRQDGPPSPDQVAKRADVRN